MDKNELFNAEEFSLSFSEEASTGAMERIRAVFAESQSTAIKAFAANVLIGNIPAKKLGTSVGDVFELCGFNVKHFRFKEDDRAGKYITLFGYTAERTPCAYDTSSDKIFDALMKIVVVYGEPSAWKNGVMVKIRMNSLENGKAYSLEVLN